MRNSQVSKLTQLFIDQEMGGALDAQAHLSAGITTNWGARASALLDAALRNSTPEEARAAEDAADKTLGH